MVKTRMPKLQTNFVALKAFDPVDHNILLKKIQHCCIRGIDHRWFKSYLENRKQFVSAESELGSVNYSVPQSSVIGPLSFFIYMNLTKLF